MLFLFISLASGSTLNKSNLWEYNKPNRIDICIDAPVTLKQVEEALDYWGNYVDTNNISVNKGVKCEKYEYLSVQIKSDSSIKKYHAVTETRFYENNKKEFIHSATIKFSENFIKENNITLKHEIGHALGFVHSDHPIMKKYH